MVEYDNRDFWGLIFRLKGSILQVIAPKVITITVLAAGYTGIHFYVHKIVFSAVPFSIVGVALGLLLVFRTNTAYDRFWEGRKLWGQVVNAARNFAIQVRGYLAEGEESAALQADVIRKAAAFCYLMKQHLRGEYHPGEVEHLLDEQARNAVDAAGHKPVCAIADVTRRLERARAAGLVSDVQVAEIHKDLSELIDCLGGCERILKTPLPLAYVLHIKRFLGLFCLVLPVGLVDALGWWTVPSMLFIAYSFFGIEEIGIEIEDPFGRDPNDLPLDEICQTIDRNLQELLPGAPAAGGAA
ncbi:MAG: hypothetical protein JXR96_20185 [Deltaproteobacteria bacterium]|nr:hypothetical protein [Deltaproteobacteria bacterium]